MQNKAAGKNQSKINMIYLIVIYTVLFLIVGYEFLRAPAGYEDQNGFHEQV